MHTATREFAWMLRAFLLPSCVDTYKTPSSAVYSTPTPCGRLADEVDSVQNECLAMARRTLLGAACGCCVVEFIPDCAPEPVYL